MFKEIDLDTATEKDLLQTLNHNKTEAYYTRKEIEKIKKANEESRKIKTEIVYVEPPKYAKKVKEKEIDLDFEDEISFYMGEIEKLMEDDLEQYIEEALPVRKNYNYKKILLRLQAEFLKQIKIIKELINEEIDNLQEADLQEIKDEINKDKKIIKLINKELTKKEENITEKNVENRLIFIPTQTGNIRVIDEIERIPQEYLDSFKELFNSIIDGTFKNIKTFKNNNVLVGITEVKNFKTRVVFDRIGKHDYAIISAFMKKSDNDKGYIDFVKHVVTQYNIQKDKIIESLQKEEFIEEQEKIKEELFNLLPQDEVIKSNVKGGNNND